MASEHDLRLIPGYDPFAHGGDFVYDPEAGAKPIEFFNLLLTHVKGEKAGQRFVLEPWQRAIMANLFGWKRTDGTRRYRECFIYVPRKNGKTAMAAGIGTYVLFCDREPGSEIYCAACDREQAALVFDMAKGMVLAEKHLAELSEPYRRSIVLAGTNSSFKVLSSDTKGKYGFNSHLVIVDELHAHPNRELVDVLLTSVGARRQPIVVHITTADYSRESICNEKYEYACKVRDGIIPDPEFLPVIYEADKEDDWKDPPVWRKANPNLGISVKESYISRECAKAAEQPAYQNVFRRLHLNTKTEQVERWIEIDSWDDCKEVFLESEMNGCECWGGLDLGSTRDLTAFVLLFPQPSGGFRVLPWFWAPKDSAERRERCDRVPYVVWSSKGYIATTPGNATDYAVVRRDINELGKRFRIKKIAIDRLFQGSQLSMELAGDGFAVEAFGQGFFSMAAPTKEFERLIIERKIHHDGNPVLRWMASNVVVEMDAAGNMKPTKKDRQKERIDGIVAAIMALGLATAGCSAAMKKSIYETRGLMTV